MNKGDGQAGPTNRTSQAQRLRGGSQGRVKGRGVARVLAEKDLTPGGGHTGQGRDPVTQTCTRETHVTLLNHVTPVNAMKTAEGTSGKSWAGAELGDAARGLQVSRAYGAGTGQPRPAHWS